MNVRINQPFVKGLGQINFKIRITRMSIRITRIDMRLYYTTKFDKKIDKQCNL